MFKLMDRYLKGLKKKIGLKVMLEGRYEKLEEYKEIQIRAELDIAYYKANIEEMKEELEDSFIRQRNSEVEVANRAITEEEARNEQVYKEVVKNLKKVEGKLFKSKVRTKNLFGD